MRHASPLFAISTALFLLACGSVSNSDADAGGDGDGDAGAIDAPSAACTGDIPLAELKECYTETICRLFSECQGQFASVDECRPILYDFFRSDGFDLERNIDQLIAAVGAGKVALDETALGRCLNPTDSCNLSDDACDLVFTGLVADGAACFESFECGSNGSCSALGQGTALCRSGTCENAVGLGAPCSNGERCERGLACSADVTGARTCTSGDAGEPCLNGADCDNLRFCDDVSKLCKDPGGLGATCSGFGQCAGALECVAGTCQRPDTEGDACVSSCIGALFCDDSLAAPVCRPLPELGQSCAVSNRCLGSSIYCAGNGLCLQRGAVDQPCEVERSSCRAGLYCDRTAVACAAPKGVGQPCAEPQECESFFCDSSGIIAVCGGEDLCY